MSKIVLKLPSGRYELGAKLGSGNHSGVYLAKHLATGTECAVKLEKLSHRTPMLLYESKVLRQLQRAPKRKPLLLITCRGFATNGDYNCMGMDLAGPTLDDILTIRKKLSLTAVLKVADQLVERFEQLHDKGWLHRSVKPPNIVLGHRSGELAGKVLIIDFGRANKYRRDLNSKKQHIPYREDTGRRYQGPYFSVNACLGTEYSRRDDMVALGYVLIKLLRGSLPWDELANLPWEMLAKKSSTSVEQLCAGLPPEFALYMTHCLTLKFAASPDYAYLRELFRSRFSATQGARSAGKAGWSDWPFNSAPPATPATAAQGSRKRKAEAEPS